MRENIYMSIYLVPGRHIRVTSVLQTEELRLRAGK